MTSRKSRVIFSLFLVSFAMSCLAVMITSTRFIKDYKISEIQPIPFNSIREDVLVKTHGNQTGDMKKPFHGVNNHRPRLVFDSLPKLPYFPSGSSITARFNNNSITVNRTGYKNKLITIYNKPEWFKMSRCSGGMSVCPVSCRCSNDHHDVTHADAVVFFAVRLPKTVPQKSSSQVWIFYGTEPPSIYSATYKLPIWRLVFNWTMTYRLDSDIVLPISTLIKAPVTTNKNYTAIAVAKTRSAVWIVSNCYTQSKREEYVKKLRKYFPVDIYGRCGSNGKESGSKADIIRDYRFYLSFENSLCVDYVTEKYFDLIDSDIDVVSVVRGGADYNKLVPEGTYINTVDFSSPRALAGYLKYLERNVTAYVAFLQEKDKYVVEGTIKNYQSAFCDLCVRLHGNAASPPSDTATWLNHEACRQPHDY